MFAVGSTFLHQGGGGAERKHTHKYHLLEVVGIKQQNKHTWLIGQIYWYLNPHPQSEKSRFEEVGLETGNSCTSNSNLINTTADIQDVQLKSV